MREKSAMGNALEGESYVGKSTTIEIMREFKEVRDSGIFVVPEYTVMGTLPKFPRETKWDIKQAIQTMIDLEKRRTDMLTNDLSKKDGDGIVVFDRGPISCIAFEYAAEHAGFTGASLWMAESFQKEIEDGNIIVPAGMIYLTAPRKIIEQREKDHIAKGHRNILDFLKNNEVIGSLNEAFRVFGDHLPEQLFLTLSTGNKNPNEVGAEVLQFIKDQPKDILDNVPDFIAYANSLIDKK